MITKLWYIIFKIQVQITEIPREKPPMKLGTWCFYRGLAGISLRVSVIWVGLERLCILHPLFHSVRPGGECSNHCHHG